MFFWSRWNKRSETTELLRIFPRELIDQPKTGVETVFVSLINNPCPNQAGGVPVDGGFPPPPSPPCWKRRYILVLYLIHCQMSGENCFTAQGCAWLNVSFRDPCTQQSLMYWYAFLSFTPAFFGPTELSFTFTFLRCILSWEKMFWFVWNLDGISLNHHTLVSKVKYKYGRRWNHRSKKSSSKGEALLYTCKYLCLLWVP